MHDLAWESYLQPDQLVCQIPVMKLAELVDYVKMKLNIRTLGVDAFYSECQAQAIPPFQQADGAGLGSLRMTPGAHGNSRCGT